MTELEIWKNMPEELETHTEYLPDTSEWEVVLFDTETKKQVARLVVIPKTEEGGRFLGIITKDNIKVMKAEITD